MITVTTTNTYSDLIDLDGHVQSLPNEDELPSTQKRTETLSMMMSYENLVTMSCEDVQ
jgi:hypothetical protein